MFLSLSSPSRLASPLAVALAVAVLQPEAARTQEAEGAADPDVMVLVGGTVIASPDAAPLPDAVVVVEDGRIAAVGPRGSVEIPEDDPVLSIDGRYVTAGFWNAHVHLGGFVGRSDTLSDTALSRVLEMALTRWGFVHAFEPHTSDLANTLAIRRRIADGSVPGPSLLTTGPAFDPPAGDHLGMDLPEIATPEDARSQVRHRIAQGVDGIKLMTGSLAPDAIVPMPLEVARAAVETAHAADVPVLAHPSDETGARIAVEAGVDALAHLFATDVGPDWNRGLIDRMLEREIAVIPTLMLFGPSAVARAQLRRFHEGGGDVVFGTDLGYLTEPDPTSEYWLMERAGMEPRDILAALTTAPARFFGRGEETGRVAPGYAADLVVLAGDPLEDVAAFPRVRYAVRDGRVVYGGGAWDADAWERTIGRPYVRLVRGIPTVAADRSEVDPVPLSAEQLRLYEGTYRWGEEPVSVRVEDGRLQITPIEGLEVTHLVPLGEHEFVQGLQRGGRLVEIYYPRTRVRFVVEDGRATALHARTLPRRRSP